MFCIPIVLPYLSYTDNISVYFGPDAGVECPPNCVKCTSRKRSS